MKKKILQVSCNGLNNGGVQNVIMSIVRNLSDEYLFDILVFTSEEEHFDKEFCSYGGSIFRIPHKPQSHFFKKDIDLYFRGLRIIKGTYYILKQHGPYEAIHCHNFFESALCLIAAKKARIKIRIVHSHMDFSPLQKRTTTPRALLLRAYKKIMQNFVTDRLACSQKASDYLFGSKKQSVVINNAIDLGKFNPQKYINLEKTNDEPLHLLHVGNFCQQKNQKFLICIAEELVKRNINFDLTMVGGFSEYQVQVEGKIGEKNLRKFIRILPHYTNIPEIMAQSDLFVFPSLFEGLGIVLVEAQAMKLYCLVSAIVPQEANLGNVEFVTGYEASLWADHIENFFHRKPEKKTVDMSSYDITKVSQLYRKIYAGENCLITGAHKNMAQ